MSLVYLILGGNQGNSTEIISRAIDLVTSEIGSKLASSACYESESWGFKSEPFINQIIIIETIFSPFEVLARTQQIELLLGRIRKTGDYEARIIDIDLLYYDSLILNSENLTLPHPRIADRKFVLMPLAEIAPGFRDPSTQLTILEMLESCTDNSAVKRLY
jgi:2-amino-4-hydroxy-6-hydroxymethyldihydropteridine diphosphokinase